MVIEEYKFEVKIYLLYLNVKLKSIYKDSTISGGATGGMGGTSPLMRKLRGGGGYVHYLDRHI